MRGRLHRVLRPRWRDDHGGRDDKRSRRGCQPTACARTSLTTAEKVQHGEEQRDETDARDLRFRGLQKKPGFWSRFKNVFGV